MICTCALAGTPACNNCPNNKMIAGYTVIDFKTPVIKTPNKDELEIISRLNHHILDLQEENKKLKELLNEVQL